MTSWVYKDIKLISSPIWSFLRVENTKFPCSTLCHFYGPRTPFSKGRAFLASSLRFFFNKQFLFANLCFSFTFPTFPSPPYISQDKCCLSLYCQSLSTPGKWRASRLSWFFLLVLPKETMVTGRVSMWCCPRSFTTWVIFVLLECCSCNWDFRHTFNLITWIGVKWEAWSICRCSLAQPSFIKLWAYYVPSTVIDYTRCQG